MTGSGDKRDRKTFLTPEALRKRRSRQRQTRRAKRGIATLGIVALLILGFASAGALARGTSLLDTITGDTGTTATDTTVASDSTSTADTSTADSTSTADTSTTDTTATDTTATDTTATDTTSTDTTSTDTTTTGGKGPNGAAGLALVDATLPSSVQLYQWATDGTGWITGNLGSHNSSYTEGQTIPFRLDVSGIAAGNYTFGICRDFTSGGDYGYLKLTPFETTENTGDSVAGSSGPISASSGITLDSATDTGATGGCNSGQVEFDVNFDSNGGTNEFIYWGGYLAKPGDAIPPPGSGTVPFQHSAGFFPGSSLHMVLLSPAKDRSINPGSINILSAITVQKFFDAGATPTSFCFNISPNPSANTPNHQCTGPNNIPGSVQFLDLPSGTYTVTEEPQTGYLFNGTDASDVNCTFTASTGSAVVVSSTNPQFATCDFHNKVAQTKATVGTVIKNAADDSTVSGPLAVGSSVYDTASITNLVSGQTPTGTLSFKFFSTINCSDAGVAAGSGVALTGHSSTEGPLSPGSYGFEAQYVAGTNDPYTTSDWGSCEPLTISPGAVTVSTVIKNAAATRR